MQMVDMWRMPSGLVASGIPLRALRLGVAD